MLGGDGGVWVWGGDKGMVGIEGAVACCSLSTVSYHRGFFYLGFIACAIKISWIF